MSTKNQTTPMGSALWAKVQVPDTRFSDEGVYKIDLVIAKDAAQDMIDQFRLITEEYKKKEVDQKAIDHPKFHVHEPWETNEDGWD